MLKTGDVLLDSMFEKNVAAKYIRKDIDSKDSKRTYDLDRLVENV
jgi:hypothetical protein